MSKKGDFYILLFGAMLLEAAGYLAFPFLALRLRDGYGMPQAEVGLVLSIALWVRPVASLTGGWTAKQVRSQWLLSLACVLEATCFLTMGLSHTASIAVIGLILGNIGFSLWTPNLFALTSALSSAGEDTKRISYLTGFLNAGAALGCVLGGIAAAADTQIVFLLTGFAYLAVIPVLFPIVKRIQPENLNIEETVVQRSGAVLQWSALVLSLGTMSYWAMYGQFNAFFAVYISDWMRNNAITGLAFGGLALFVAGASYLYTRVDAEGRQLVQFVRASLLGIGIGWILLSSAPGLVSIIVFIATLAASEAFVGVYLTKRWNSTFKGNLGFAQGLNFAFRSVGMGIGGIAAGLTYSSPKSAHNISIWALSNVILIGFAYLSLVVRSRPHSGSIDSERTLG